MLDPNTFNSIELEDLDSPTALQSLSLMNNKICPFSPSKVSDLTISEENTSDAFKVPQRKLTRKASKNFILDISSMEAAPQNLVTQHLADLKSKLYSLTDKFKTHQNGVKNYESENIHLKDKIAQLQQSLILVSETSLQKKSKCKLCAIW